MSYHLITVYGVDNAFATSSRMEGATRIIVAELDNFFRLNETSLLIRVLLMLFGWDTDGTGYRYGPAVRTITTYKVGVLVTWSVFFHALTTYTSLPPARAGVFPIMPVTQTLLPPRYCRTVFSKALSLEHAAPNPDKRRSISARYVKCCLLITPQHHEHYVHVISVSVYAPRLPVNMF